MRAPSELDFLAAFGVNATTSDRDQGLWAYRFASGSTTVEFSFRTSDDSVQTRIVVDDREVAVVVHERATQVEIWEERGASGLRVAFEPGAVMTGLEVDVWPVLAVRWSSLRTG